MVTAPMRGGAGYYQGRQDWRPFLCVPHYLNSPLTSFAQLLHRPKQFLLLSHLRKRLLLEACGCLVLARWRLGSRPFARTIRLLRQPLPRRAACDTPAGCLRLAREVRWSVLTAARILPGESVCLPRSVAVLRMLRRRGVPSCLYLGVAHGEDGAMKAHAWLRLDGVNIMGGGPRGHTAVQSFEPTGPR